MRILINATSVTDGGGQAVAEGLIGALGALYPDDTIDVFAQRDFFGGTPLPNNVRVFVDIRTHSITYRTLWEQTILRVRCRTYDVVVGLAGFAVLWTRKPQVVVAQNALYFVTPDGSSIRTRLKATLRRLCFMVAIRSGVHCVAVSEFMADLVRQGTSVPEARLTVIRNAPSLSETEAQTLADSRREHTSGRSVLWIGSDSPHKNLEEFVDAIGPILADGLVETVSVAGRYGPRPSSKFFGDPRVRWLGRLERSDLRKEMAAADLVVVTSLLESSSLVPLEALQLGTVVIASDIPAHSDVLPAGLLYRVGSHRQLSLRIVQALDAGPAQDPTTPGSSVRETSWLAQAAEYRTVFSKATADWRS